MTSFNFQWVADNFEDTEDFTILIVGIANIAEVIDIKSLLPKSKIHAFECAKVWESINRSVTDATGKHTFLENVYYHHVAVSDHDGTITFYPSDKHMQKDWPWSGSVLPPSEYSLTEDWEWGEPYTVPCISLNSFCKTHNTKPDVIHMDVQGAEYLALHKLDINNKPKCMWLEISAFCQYETNTSYEELNNLLLSYGYRQEYKNNHDALYVLQELTVTPYEDKE